MPQSDITYIGRNDGLGNRLEEIIVLCAYAERTQKRINYLFNNLGARDDRSYPLLVSVVCPLLTLTDATRSKILLAKARSKFGRQQCFGINDLPTLRLMTDAESLQESARKIVPLFDLPPQTGQVSAIHIRGSDRIDPNGGPHFLKSRKQLEVNIDKAIAHRKAEQEKDTFIFSDEPALVRRVTDNLPQSGSVVPRRARPGLPDEYLDLFSMAQCDEIVMAGAPSSFCLVAAMIGNVPVSYVYLPPDLRHRFPVQYREIEDSQETQD